MKFDASTVLYILGFVLCNEKMLTWLKAEAKKTETPIDDTAIAIIEMFLCQKEQIRQAHHDSIS